jgi:NAD(P)H-dependent FMN reductase
VVGEGGPTGASLRSASLPPAPRAIVARMSENPTIPIRLAVVIGSVREGRFGPTVAAWVAGEAAAYGGFDVTIIDLADYDIPLALPAAPPKYAGDAYPRPASTAGLTAALDAADAYILITPEYNHSYPASLKAAIDWHFTQWTAKPVAFVSYGGATGGRHAVLHLENVLTELHAVTIRDGLAFPNYFTTWTDGQPTDPDAAAYAKTLLHQLAWWATTLRTARANTPYPEN